MADHFLHVFDHPLIKDKVTMMRDENTGTKDFRKLANEVAGLMLYEMTKDLKTKTVEISTPLVKTKQQRLAQQVVAVPILRAGLGFVDIVCELIPNVKIGHVGVQRDEETLKPTTYYAKLPQGLEDSYVIVLDPMLATGGSAVATIDTLKEKGAKKILFMGLVGVDEGVKTLHEAHPDVQIYLAAKDEKLNEKGYIVPGLGDAGDRIFGTY